MSHHFTTFEGSVTEAVKKAIEGAIEGSTAEVTGQGGHFNIVVTAPAFQGKSMLQSHQMVLASIAHLMKGDTAPVHAVDSLKTRSA
ncbi:MAG TPA: BolA/IbaG family iron-sulfur metabolism protein [Polyangiaceae bacterium]|jgi:acid stress-induced BolA-like protein IbaG/YrbA|nr:BolA/IbaG family iron-sulfur metabolism protein [Polyangiaceae bacterium]